MRAGELRHNITIENPATTENAAGETSREWTARASNVPASIRGLSVRERTANGLSGGVATHEIRLRYLDRVTTESRVRFDSRVFQIESVMNIEERNIELVLHGTEVLKAAYEE